VLGTPAAAGPEQAGRQPRWPSLWSSTVRTFVIGGSDYRNHTILAHRMQDYLRWRNANARHPDVLAAQRRERARMRSERQQRWGRPKVKAA
jgi:hypothetical protein